MVTVITYITTYNKIRFYSKGFTGIANHAKIFKEGLYQGFW